MKQRTGFVSNSSSSSFILYGACANADSIIDILIAADKDKFEQLTGCANEQDALEKYEEDYDGDLACVFNQFKFGVDIDDYADEDGEYMIGLQANPEYLSKDQVLNGLWSKEQIAQVDAFFENTKLTPHVDGGTKYC